MIAASTDQDPCDFDAAGRCSADPALAATYCGTYDLCVGHHVEHVADCPACWVELSANDSGDN